MALLVDYSDSESDSETVAQPAAKPAPAPSTNAAGKKPLQKVVDRSNPRKIVVNIGANPAKADGSLETVGDEPPAKRARTGGSGAFGSFASLLPPPKNRAQPAAQQSGRSNSGTKPPRVGVNLKTGATPGFSRSTGEDHDGEDGEASNKQPSIPDGQKPADEVKLVGKPLMFRPLSVSRKPKKKMGKSGATAKAAATAASPISAPSATVPGIQLPEPPKKKVSLFSISAETEETADVTPSNGTYEPMFAEAPGPTDDFAAYDAQYSSTFAEPGASHTGPMAPHLDSLESIASDMNLDAAARRELFGRSGVPVPSQSASRVINFNTDQEYAHNEELRAAGEQQVFNPVRAIAPGKHSLQQLVNQVQNQKDALEESFAMSRNNQKEAGQRYGWR